ncbi:MAG: NYN domain-containing protein [Eubacteriales bacterium]
MKKTVVGIIAHVDAGKTTLAEAMLYRAGRIKKQGRVDKRDTFLDTHEIERERGITIFSKMARLSVEKSVIILLDTPGHVDFSAETERSLSVLDCAVLVISGSEGVQAHTETLWSLLAKHRIPTFIFVTKMDLAGSDRNSVMRELKNSFGDGAVDFGAEDSAKNESIALCDEALFEKYLASGVITDEETASLIADRRLFPCFFGSGLKLDGVDDLLRALDSLTKERNYSDSFAAKVYKIAHDPGGNRLTYMKITGGALSNRQIVDYSADGENFSEKISGIRLYSGAKFESAENVCAGEICAVTGLSKTFAGQGIGGEKGEDAPSLVPVMSYRIKLPPEVSPVLFLPKLRELEEEEPLLGIVWNERFGEIHAQIMGQVQTEVLSRLISDRFSIDVGFDDGRIMYKETVTGTAEGVGHFEPLRHYAEVHLKIEPMPRGSGLVFDADCVENTLDTNWQRLILTHLEEKTHLGVMTGSPITDAKITLVSGRAHLKHTQGGDFREATYRALRQGLMTLRSMGKTELLEPYYAFRLELPGEYVGRAISDITAKFGSISEHEAREELSSLTGLVPVSEMSEYANEVAAYTHGKGRLSLHFDGFYPCHNTDEVVEKYAYDPTADMDNTPDSVFCSHGAGFIVPWNSVPQYMHLEMRFAESIDNDAPEEIPKPKIIEKNLNIDEKELEAIMEREFGPIRRPVYSEARKPVIANERAKKPKKSLYIVDGYNVIFAWDELAAIAEYDLEGARVKLCDILANYKAFTGRDIILVFDAYNVKGAVRRKLDYHGLAVVYTKEGELGDTYIEKLVYEIGEDFSVRVITSDALIQLQALRSGVLRMSAREFRDEVIKNDAEIEKILLKLSQKPREKK